MSYQVLARKWRPRSFREMVGQEHVLKALINALDHNRLHHAYLFTGTRGVGKTTIARILAKCLNCETGVSSEPCGKCSACEEITQGRFVDLIEVDAASRTRVEDTREILDNVQYAPTRGRYKIYLIDEVHMLSNHSFNALLKTLEEPPEHVKFLLATTDPQKLPVTILSRCLQFNLKNMSPERIVNHLQHILKEEMVPHDESALWLLARSADGSMRDALSLTDQAIGFGNGKIADSDVSVMLGTIDHRLIERLVGALIQSNGSDLMQAVAEFAEQSPDYYSALGDLTTLLHRIAIAQAIPEALDNSFGDRDQILKFASQLTAEDVQLYYQTALLGRRDLPLAPEPRSGFEMTLLRMLAFRPQGVADVPTAPLHSPQASNQPTAPIESPNSKADASAQQSSASAGSSSAEPHTQTEQAEAEQVQQPKAAAEAQPEPPRPIAQDDYSDYPEMQQGAQTGGAPTQHSDTRSDSAVQEGSQPGKKPQVEQGARSILTELKTAAQLKRPEPKPAIAEAPQPPVREPSKASASLADFQSDQWINLFEQMDIKGVLLSTAANCILLGKEGNQFYFALDEAKASLFDDSHAQRLSDRLSDYFQETVKAHIDLRLLGDEAITPAKHQAMLKAAAKAAAIEKFQNDPVMRSLEQDLGAQINLDSIELFQFRKPQK